MVNAGKEVLNIGTHSRIAHCGAPGDGVVAVQSVEKLYRIRNKSEVMVEELRKNRETI
jgi:nitrogen regulatory protein PII